MKTISEIIDELEKFPPDALAYAYEGEITGIVIVKDAVERKELGVIPTSEV